MSENNIKGKSIQQLFFPNQKRIIFILEMLLVGIFALIAWQLENRVFAIFIILFFIIALNFQKRRYITLIIVPIIVFVLFNTLTLDAFTILTKSALPAIQHPKAELTNLFTPNSGLGVLPPKVLTMISILNENKVESYKLSENFSNDVVIYQRIVEGAWPIKLENTSSYLLMATDEIVDYPNCMIIEEKEDVALVNCH
jgi:hypothetical protein